MSCLHNVDNICKLKHINCVFPSEDCKHYKTLDTLVKEAITVDKETKHYCKYCFNARIYKPTDEERMDPYNTELTDENDYSSCGVGHCSYRKRFMITSGYGEPLRIEFEEYFPDDESWHIVGKYYPKYCPECGRRIDEYEKDNNNH